MNTFLSLSPLAQSFLLIFFLQLIFFLLAFSFKTDKFTDLLYGTSFIINAFFFYLLHPNPSLPLLILLILVSLWGLRLSLFLFIRILKTKQDQRFQNIRPKFFKFAGFWLLQAITIFIVSLPITLFLTTNPLFSTTLTLPSILALLFWFTGFLIETIADQQKYHFKNQSKNKNRWISSGLWKYSQHPNYFGEILCWWSIFLFTLSYLPFPQNIISLLGPIYITFLILFVSGIPPLQKRYQQKYAKNKTYQRYHQNTSLLVPLPSKKTN